MFKSKLLIVIVFFLLTLIPTGVVFVILQPSTQASSEIPTSSMTSSMTSSSSVAPSSSSTSSSTSTSSSSSSSSTPSSTPSSSSIANVTLSFVSNEGTVVNAITAQPGTAVSAPTNPTRTGYTFAGWFSDESLTTAYTFSSMPSQATTLYAKWTINQYTITFDSNDGTAVNPITQDFGTTVSAPTNPTRTGYTFAGWFSDEALTTAYSFTTMPSQATTLYAKWTISQYSISFNSTGGSAVDRITQDFGTSVSAPTNPTRTGYTFTGWLTISLTPYTFTVMPSQNITLYAGWTINQYTITFVSNQGTSVTAITQDFGTSVSAPTNPTRTGYTFAGWFSDEALTTSYTFTTMPSQSITLYAKWTINQYTITFDSNDGTSVTAITQDFGTAVSAPTNPTRTGYTFAGWFSDEALSTSYTFTTMPSQSITLYAKWTINQASINFVGGGDSHSLAVSSTGRVYAWGNNSNNELGDGTTTGRRTPTLISFTGLQVGETIQKISAGQLHSLALTTNGRVYAWGNNNSGQLGDGSTTNRSSPTLINFSGLLSGETIQTVIAGQLHSLAVTTTGRVYAWGNGSSGQLGNGSTSNSSSPTLVNFTGLLSGETIQQVSGGAYHSISVTTSGRIYAWGYNGNGELGDETTINRSSPKLISLTGLQGGETVQMVVAGSYHSLALTTNNRIYTWGANGYGQLGSGTFLNRITPTVIAFTGLQGGETIQQISAGNFHFLVLTSTGRLFTWGYNESGQLGNGSASNSSSPTLVNFTGLLSGETIQQVSGGAYHSISVTSTGRLFAWGFNGSGQLGDNTIISKNRPTLITVS